MMSRNGLPHGSTKCPKPSSIELTVETLMGTSFEIKVCGHDTITMVKNKIQSAEGIPSSQQHLLYNMEELQDRERICSYPISSGTTLKLVVSMRVGPISTKRAPEVDELAWRELQELISDTPKEDLINRLPPKTKLTVLIFQDGDQVNFLKILENEDGTFSPLSDDWNGSSFRTLFSRSNAVPEDTEEKLEGGSFTMNKVQELQDKLEALAIQERERMSGDPAEGQPVEATIASRTFASKTDSQKSVRVVSYLTSGMQHQLGTSRMFRRHHRDADEIERTRCLLPSLLFPKMLSSKTKIKEEVELMSQVYKEKRAFGAASHSGSGSGSGSGLKRPPLPEIRRPALLEKEKVTASQDERSGDKLREKTATSYATAAERSAASPAPTCSFHSPAAPLRPTDEISTAAALSLITGGRATSSRSRSAYRMPSYGLEGNEAPKTIPGKSDEGKGAKAEAARGATKESKSSTAPKQKPVSYPRLFRRLSRMVPVTKAKATENGKEKESKREDSPPPLVPASPKKDKRSQQNIVKQRVKCLECKKKLNITNTYFCRCGDGPFCGEHRYSEAHDCAIDYKLQGRRVIRKGNPMVAPSKLPRI